MIVHEAFGHGVEMDMFVKKRALAEKYIGEYVASPLVTMHDGAAAASETATFFFLMMREHLRRLPSSLIKES